jgi:hypothetical protein
MKIRDMLVLMVLMVLMGLPLAAQGKTRSGQYDFGFKVNYLSSMDIKGENGSKVNLTDDVGFGFLFGYNYTEHLNFSFEFSYNQPGYTATVVSDEVISREFTTRNKLDILNSQFNTTYNFTQKDITPFISAGLGWSYMDSNVPTGRYEEFCVWDPWYGYACGGLQDTYDAYNFSYNASAGFRWDIDRTMYATASYTNVWYDFDHAKTLSTESFQIQIGMKY